MSTNPKKKKNTLRFKKSIVITACTVAILITFGAIWWIQPGSGTKGMPENTAEAMTTAATPEATALVSPEPGATEAPVASEAPGDPQSSVAEFTFTASGDNLIHSCLYDQAAARGRSVGKAYDFSYCYENVAYFFKDKDLNWINQETLVNIGYPASGYPTFSTPGQVVKDLRKYGFTVFNTSSNHSYDKSSGGLVAAMKFWNKMATKKESKAAYQVGIVKRSYPLPQLIREVNGIKVGFLSYTYGTNGITIDSGSTYRVVYLSEKDRIEKQVKDLRKQVDVVMVSCHWGEENSHTISAEQRTMAQNLVSWGADVIIGTHPHVLQDCAWVKAGGRKGFCAYSLGNFISGQVQSNQILGGTLTTTIRVDKSTGTVKIIKPKLKPVVTIYGEGRSRIHVKWLEDYNEDDAAFQSSHISRAGFANLARRVVRQKFLDY